MMRWYALCGLLIGGVVALGQLSSAQLVAIAGNVQLWIALHWSVLVPWLLALLFGRLWWQAEQRAQEFEQLASQAITTAQRTQQIMKQVMRPAPAKRTKATRY